MPVSRSQAGEQAAEAAEARALAERYRALVDAISQVVWVTDERGCVQEDSPSWRAFTGQTLEQWRGSGWRDALHPEDRERVVASWERAVATGAPYDVEYRLRRADGHYVPMHEQGAPVRGPEGRVREWVGTCKDISARKDAEARLRESAEVRELLLAAVSHDLRGPLNAIALCAAALQKQHGVAGSALQAVGLIAASAERMRQLLGSLLDFSRARSGTLVLERRPSNLQPVVQRAVEEVLLVHPERAVALACEGPHEGEFDAAAVARVASNLVGNAVQYSPADEPVWVELKGSGEAVVLTVHNRGAPIPPELLPHLFEPFRRGEGRGVGGLGLGLYIVRELVEAHGGHVDVSSTEEAGTRFTITLPRTRDAR
ncbi:MAG: PAS domain-containing sensor histidine kinase [Myxococcaceae bacterium]|nr:PAS domain-containing sensor histidine kinase [Myxococcaceae bacterium]MCI0672153.1 PAS domain-containing sensor histidine kinase [Myxococcaceae bacterium]